MTSTGTSTRGRSTGAATEPPLGGDAARAVGDVEAAVRRDLAEIRDVDERVAESGLAFTAIELARQLDDTTNSATAKAGCAKALHSILDRLRDLAPAREEDDEVDDLKAKTERKLGR